MTAAELIEKLRLLPNDAKVCIVDRVGASEEIVSAFVDNGHVTCSEGHKHPRSQLWLGIDNRFQ